MVLQERAVLNAVLTKVIVAGIATFPAFFFASLAAPLVTITTSSTVVVHAPLAVPLVTDITSVSGTVIAPVAIPLVT